MKRFITIVAPFALAICLLSCSYEGTYDEGYYDGYEDGYSDGYEDGYSDAKFEMECLIEEKYLGQYDKGYERGYDNGHLYGYQEAEEEYSYYGWLEDEAISYAREYSEWSPEEAMGLIEAYQNNEPFWQDGSPPSHEEYLDAIESLCRFYEYFYCAMYE